MKAIIDEKILLALDGRIDGLAGRVCQFGGWLGSAVYRQWWKGFKYDSG
jgi:hypothetical protein